MARSLVKTNSGVINLEHVAHFQLYSDRCSLYLNSAYDPQSIIYVEETETDARAIINAWVNAHTIRPRTRSQTHDEIEKQ